MRELRSYLEGRVDLQKLLDQLRFNADDLEQATLRQPKLYLTASRIRAQVMEEAARAKRKYEQLVSEKKLKLRRRYTGKDKLSEGGLTDTINRDLDVRKARVRLDRANALEEFSKLLVDSFRQRRDTIRNLVEIRNGEINNEIQSVRRRMEQRGIDKVRKKARERYSELDERYSDE